MERKFADLQCTHQSKHYMKPLGCNDHKKKHVNVYLLRSNTKWLSQLRQLSSYLCEGNGNPTKISVDCLQEPLPTYTTSATTPKDACISALEISK